VYFDFAMVEGPGGVERLRRKVSAQRVVFGSNFPLYYFESAVLKVREAALPDEEQRAVLEGNAHRLLVNAIATDSPTASMAGKTSPVSLRPAGSN
jgi:hypothetical protein